MVQPHEAQRHDGSPAHEASSHPREQTLFSRYVVKQACGLAGYPRARANERDPTDVEKPRAEPIHDRQRKPV